MATAPPPGGGYDNDGGHDLYLARGYGCEVDFMQSEEYILRAGGTTGAEWEGVDFETMGGVMLALYRNGAQRLDEVYIGDGNMAPADMPLVLTMDDPRACGEPTATGEGPAYKVWRACPGNLWHSRWRGETSGAVFTAQVSAQCKLHSVESLNQDFTSVPYTPNVLFHNNGDGTCRDVSEVAGVADQGNARGATWIDVDNDGWLDLFVVNNGNARVGNGADRLYHNQGDGHFVEVGLAAGVAGDASGRGGTVAWADYDNDGWLDLLVTNGFGPPPGGEGPHRLHHNVAGANHWLEVKLIDRYGGLGSGARVVLRTGQQVQVRQQTGGASLFSQNSQSLHFGLGEASHAECIDVHWPSGIVQTVTDVRADRPITLVEPES